MNRHEMFGGAPGVRRRGVFRRMLGVAVLAGSLTAIVAPAASARPLVCLPDSVRYNITSTNKDILETHGFAYATLAPGGDAHKTITATTSYQAGVTVSGSGTVAAGVVLAKAEVTVGFSLQANGTWTDSTQYSDGITNGTNSTHEYVFFEGVRRGRGTWASDICRRDGTGWASYNTGNWGSWEAMKFGVLRCDNDPAIGNQFGTFSVQYKAVRTC
jgi:hypothetical protein